MYLFRGSDGLPCACPEPEPQPSQWQRSPLWDFVQKASLLLGLIVTVRSLVR